MKLKTERQCELIVNNIVKACGDINKLNKTGYDFIYLASGFIAHCNLHGFIDYYTRHFLKIDIRNNIYMNMYNNFTPEDVDYAYYMQKKRIYQQVLERLSEEDEARLSQTNKQKLTKEF